MASGDCGKLAACFDEEFVNADYTPQLECSPPSKPITGLEKLPAIGLGTFGFDFTPQSKLRKLCKLQRICGPIILIVRQRAATRLR